MENTDLIRNSKAPTRCNHVSYPCGTADPLQRCGLDHPQRCPLCDEEQEMINHLLFGSVLALNAWGYPNWTPSDSDSFSSWWPALPVSGQERRDLAISTTLICRCLWKQRNTVVLNTSSAKKIVEVVHREGMESGEAVWWLCLQ